MFLSQVRQLLLLSLLVLAPSTQAETWAELPVTPISTAGENGISGQLFYLEDRERRFTAEQLLHDGGNQDWTRSRDDAATVGNVHSTFWFATRIRTPAEVREWLIRILHPLLPQVDAWVIENGDIVQQHTIGASLPFAQRPFHSPQFFLPATLAPDTEYLLLFRVQAEGVLDFPLSIATGIKTTQIILDEQFKFGIYYGFALIMVLYNLAIFLFTREISYLFYVLFVTALATFIASIDGISSQYLWPQWPQLNRYALPLFSGLLQLFGTLFTASFLDVHKRSPRLRVVLMTVAGINVVTVICALMLRMDHALMVASISTLIMFPSVLLAGIVMWRQGQLYARYFTLAWGMLCVFAVWVTLSIFDIPGLTINNVWNLLRQGSAIEMVLLALALAARINFLAKEEERARAESNAKSQFIAQVSHELRTPMNGILGMSTLLRDHLTDKQSIHFNNVIYQSGLALLGVINDVLDAAKIEADKLEIDSLPFDLRKLCTNALCVIEPQAMQKSLAVSQTIDPRLPAVVRGDPNRLRQILLNLIGNAAKFTDSGTIALSVECLSASRVRIAVTDTGAGISEADQRMLFAPYSQSGNTRHQGGTGLGLYICRRLVEMMGGRIGVRSAPGQGSSFWLELSLPASEQLPVDTGSDSRDQLAPASSDTSLNILVAEDNLANQLVIEKLLEKMGHRVTVVTNGREAADALAAPNDFNLVLMDCEMPVLDGFDACEAIRLMEKQRGQRALPIIALTAHALPEYRDKCFAVGMNDLITKPVRALNLQELLRRYSGSALKHSFDAAP